MRIQFRRHSGDRHRPRARLRAFAALTLSALVVGAMSANAFGQSSGDGVREPEREITPVRPDLYNLREEQQHTIVLVTRDGIVVGDPLSQRTAEWLQQEIGSRFPGRPVRYVLHTYHRYDRSEGAGVFADTAEIVAHRRFERQIGRARRSLPPFVDAFDSNFDRSLSLAEAARAPLSLMLEGKDFDGDGMIRARELYARVLAPTSTYDSRHRISLGGTDVEVIHVGSARAPDMTMVFFPAQRVVFAADVPAITRAPFSFGSWRPRDVMTWLRTVVALDIDAVLTDRGDTIPKADVVALAGYLETLMNTVTTGYADGRGLSDLQESGLLDADSPHYAGRASQMATVFRSLRSFWIDASAVATTTYAFRDTVYCDSFVSCSTGGAVAGATFALDVPIARSMGVTAELSLNQQYWNSRTSPTYDEETVLRQTYLAFLFRYTVLRRDAFAVATLGGLGHYVRDAQGVGRVKGVLAPIGGRVLAGGRQANFAFVGGFNLTRPMGNRLTLVVPVRISYATHTVPGRWPHRLDARVGLGLTLSIPRRPF